MTLDKAHGAFVNPGGKAIGAFSTSAKAEFVVVGLSIGRSDSETLDLVNPATFVCVQVPLSTERLAFREMTPDDLDDMAALLGDDEVMHFYSHPKSREEASAWIAWNQQLYRDHGFGLWLLTLREGGEFVGDCGLTPQEVDGLTEVELGYHLRSELQGRGLATEAAAACRDHARDVLGLKQLIAIIDPRNRPSQRVAENVGLVVDRETDNRGRWSSRQRIYAISLTEIIGVSDPAVSGR